MTMEEFLNIAVRALASIIVLLCTAISIGITQGISYYNE